MKNKPLANIKHQAFARKVAASIIDPTQSKRPSEIYSEIYQAKERSAAVGSSVLLQRPDICNSIKTIIFNAFPPEQLKKNLKSLLHSRKGVYFEGERVGSEPDNGVRLETLKTILKTVGAFNDNNPQTVNATQINFNISSDDAQRLHSIADTLNELNKELSIEHEA